MRRLTKAEGGHKEGMMNRAQENVHKGAGDDRKNASGAKKGNKAESNAGKWSPAETREAIDTSNPGTEKNPLRGAGNELRRQHPIAHDDHGPHHGKDHHLRHEPLHGLKGKKY